ncbi:hypothetical protein [Hymenobacter metallicola]|uniref:Uncharacterized protein n=1 Tax=Hymenobacter metallicola TaxID=2563114 RepID=A0A4Z0QIH9_9BACT|nr:hypothetical protein [Hymenobacter metallicola]TGE29109.1 hypothetical protein E5K02_06540 [Hymenobacter metallicola]
MRLSLIPRPLPVLVLLLALSSAFSLCWASLNSDLFIQPGKQFVLGGGQPGAFRVAARNVGKVAVEFKERPRGGGIFGRATLQPGQAATLRYMAGSTAVLLNGSAQTANVKLRVTGDTNLRMNYEPNGQQ